MRKKYESLFWLGLFFVRSFARKDPVNRGRSLVVQRLRERQTQSIAPKSGHFHPSTVRRPKRIHRTVRSLGDSDWQKNAFPSMQCKPQTEEERFFLQKEKKMDGLQDSARRQRDNRVFLFFPMHKMLLLVGKHFALKTRRM